MQLNIYLLTHPIIQILSNYTREQENESMYYIKSQQLGLFIIYEIVRKWVKIQQLYIKKINHIREISITNPNDSYSIVTDLTKSHHIINAVGNILPNTKFIHINSIEEQENTHTNEKIILFEKFLCNYKIIESIEYLLKHKQININDIKVACIICNNKVLDQIGNKYPNLEIYTTKIIRY